MSTTSSGAQTAAAAATAATDSVPDAVGSASNATASVRDAVAGDLASLAELAGRPWPSVGAVVDLAAQCGTWAVLLFRLSTALHRAGRTGLAGALRIANSALFGADVSPRAEIGPGFALPHPTGVVVGDICAGRNTRLMANVRLGGPDPADPSRRERVTIGDDCWFMDGAIVVGRSTIGDRAVISALAVVNGEVLPNAVMFGAPARVVRWRDAP